MPKPFHVPGPELSRGDEAGERDDASGLSGASLEVVPKKKRKQYPASEKLRIVKAADAALATGKRGAVEELLRKEGIYSSHLAAWRQQLDARGAEGLAARKPGRKPKLDSLPPKDVHGPADKHYGQRELLVLAPDGNLIAFGQAIPTND